MTINTFVCGFEGGAEGQWSASALAAISVGATGALHGTYGARINPSAAASNWDKAFNPAPTVIAIGRLNLRFPTLPTSTVVLMRWPNTTKSYRLIFNSSDNTIRMAHYTAGGVLDVERVGPVISAGIDFRLDWRIGGIGGATKMTWYIDGVLQTDLGPDATFTNGFATARLGELANQTMDLYVDDIVTIWTNDAADDDTVDAMFPIGEGYAKRLAPTGVGTHSGSGSFGVSSGLLADSWQLLDDLPMDTATGYVEQTTIGTGDYLEYVHADLDADETTINAMMLWATQRSPGTGANNAKLHAVVDGTDHEVYNQIWLDTASPWTVQPGAGIPDISFTRDQINAAVSRWGYSSDVIDIPRLPSLHFEVDVAVATEPEGWPDAYLGMITV